MYQRSVLAVGLAALLAAAQASAQAVSVNFTDPGTFGGPNPGADLLPTESAGVVPLTNWNNVSGVNGSTASLINSLGSATVVSVSIAGSPNSWSIPAANLPATSDGRIYQGYVDTNDTSITSIAVSGLTASGFTGTYDVYAYGVGDSNANRIGDYTIGTQSFRVIDDQQFNGTFRQSTAPGGSGPGQSGNYVRFVGLSGDSFTLTAQAAQDLAGFRAPINAIQIVANPIPEPTSLALAGAVALGGLIVRRRSRQ